MNRLKEVACRLRAQGLSLRRIADRLDVSLGTIGYWCRGVPNARTCRGGGPEVGQQKRQFAELYRNGSPVTKIATELGVPAGTLYGWRLELRLPKTPRSQYVTPEFRKKVAKGVSRDPDGRLAAEAKRLYVDEEHSTPEIAARLGFTSVTIADWLRKAGVDIRKSPTVRTRRKLREANLGDKRYNWKGGASRKASRLRLSLPMRLAREACFGRDDYTCQGCGQRGGKLNAHHLWPFSRFPRWQFEAWNLVTLCERCHWDFHNSAGGAVKMAIGPFFLNGVRKIKEDAARYEVRTTTNLRMAA